MPSPLRLALALLPPGAVGLLLAPGDAPRSPPVPDIERRARPEAGSATKTGQFLVNPAGCANVRTSERDRDLNKWQGMFPVEDFQDMLGSEHTNRSGGQEQCSELIKTIKWCPAPKEQPYLNRGAEVTRTVEQYIQKALKGTDTTRPLVVAALQMRWGDSFANTSKGIQVFNFLCGWERLGLLKKRSAIFVTDEAMAKELRRWSPNARVLYHEGIQDILVEIYKRTGVGKGGTGRALKMALAQLLLNVGKDIILSDLDVYWVRDPTPVFQKAAREDGVEFAAMRDLCWLELNSGFLYYRNTAPTRRLLEVALTTVRDKSLGGCADNDQYLINCGFARAVLDEKLNYRVLPQTDFAFGHQASIGGNYKCHEEQAEPQFTVQWLGDGLPYIWHTAGFTAPYDREVDVFAAFGVIDVDRDTGRCLAGHRGEAADAAALARMSARSCSTGPGGFAHAGCFGDCRTLPVQAASLRTSFSQAYDSWRNKSAGGQ